MPLSDNPRIPRLPNPDADHYRLDGSDRPMPRTTSVIDKGIDKPFLTKWAGNLERKTMLAELSDLLSEEMDPETSAALVARFEQRLAPEPYCEVEKKSAGVFGTACMVWSRIIFWTVWETLPRKMSRWTRPSRRVLIRN